MKKVILVLSILISFGALSAERCNITAHGSIFQTNGKVFKNVDIVDQKSTTRENSWQDCYKKAIKLAERNFSIITVELTGSSVEGGSAKTNMYVYLKWKYDDSSIPFMDTNGKVSKYTSKYETYPGPGDLRYFYDGRLFE